MKAPIKKYKPKSTQNFCIHPSGKKEPEKTKKQKDGMVDQVMVRRAVEESRERSRQAEILGAEFEGTNFDWGKM